MYDLTALITVNLLKIWNLLRLFLSHLLKFSCSVKVRASCKIGGILCHHFLKSSVSKMAATGSFLITELCIVHGIVLNSIVTNRIAHHVNCYIESPHFSTCPTYSSQQCASIPSFLLPVQLTPPARENGARDCGIHYYEEFTVNSKSNLRISSIQFGKRDMACNVRFGG